MKFLLDRCAGRRLAEWLRAQGHDVIDSRERPKDPGDVALLAWAASEERILVTIDTDFGELIFLHGERHTGLIRLPDVPAPQRIEMVREVLSRHSQDLLDGAIITIRGDRIRIARPFSRR